MSYCPICGENHDTTACPNSVTYTTYCGCQERKPHCCPVCNGQGTVSKPPWVPGDVHIWTGGSSGYVCPTCGGSGIVWG